MDKWSLIKQSQWLTKVVYNIISLRNAIRQRIAYSQELSKLRSLKNTHKGQRCFIVGTGPSLTLSDVESLKNEITFAPNRIYELLDKTTWRPTYYICQDHDIIKKFGDKIESIEAEMMFVPVEYVDRFCGDKFRFFVLKEDLYYPNDASFSRDVSKYISQGYTVMYGAIQMAVYMGFKEIYLLGVDHNYSMTRDSNGRPIRQTQQSGKNYSAGMAEYVNMNNLPRVEESTIAYETAEKRSKELGVKIYNATRGGKLEAFERVDLEKVISR